MSKPVLLSGGNGKVQELVGTNNDEVLTWDSTLDGGSWKSAPNGSGVVTMGGDVTGSSDSATVAKIQNIPVSTTDPTVGKILQYDGTEWVPADAPQGGSGGGGVMYFFNKGTSVSGGNLPANTYQLGRSAEAAQSSVALTNLATGSWTRVGGFVTDASDPSVTTVPAGLWDFNFWADTTAASNNQAYVRFTLYAYDGSTNPEAGTALAQTDNIYLYDANVIAQYIASMLIAAGTTLPSTSTRLYMLIEAQASTSNRNLTMYFGNSTPTHTHSTIPTVGGTGIIHVVDGVVQSPASPVTLSSNATGGDVTGVLKLANGGTNANLTATAGGAAYGTGTALAVTGAGSAGTVLVSAGASAPSFTTIGGAAFGSQTAKYVLAAPSGADGNPSFRQLTTSDITSFSSNAVTSLAGTTNQVLVNGGTTAVAGAVTLTLPQSIGSGSSPSFMGLTLSGLTNGIVKVSSGVLSGAATIAASEVSSIPYDLPCEIPGTPPVSTKVVNFEAVRAFTLAATGHQGGQLTAPSGNFVCTVRKNATTIGTITFGTSNFSHSITATSFAAGDVLSVETPAANLGIDTPFWTFFMTLA